MSRGMALWQERSGRIRFLLEIKIVRGKISRHPNHTSKNVKNDCRS